MTASLRGATHGGDAAMLTMLWIAYALAYTGLLVVLVRIPDLSALRDHQARAEMFVLGIRAGRAL